MANYYRQNPELFRKSAKAYYDSQKDSPEFKRKQREWSRKSAQKHRAKRYAKQREWVKAHRPRLAANAKRRRTTLRNDLLRAYGGTCKCCGESRPEFLSLDHTNGDGSAHRKEIGGSQRAGGSKTYTWLKQHGFPQDRFRLLCHNCNLARGLYGYCPHERERAAVTHQS